MAAARRGLYPGWHVITEHAHTTAGVSRHQIVVRTPSGDTQCHTFHCAPGSRADDAVLCYRVPDAAVFTPETDGRIGFAVASPRSGRG